MDAVTNKILELCKHVKEEGTTSDAELIKLRDLFREKAYIIDEMLNLEAKEVVEEDIKKEIDG